MPLDVTGIAAVARRRAAAPFGMPRRVAAWHPSPVRRLPWLPGALVLLALWIPTRIGFDYPADAQANIDSLWQSLGSRFLLADPWGSLSVLHTQPPLVNALFALDLRLTPGSHLLLSSAYLACAIATVALLGDAVVRSGASWRWAAAAGIAYALLPGTVLYSLWAYNVTTTAFLAMAAVWGAAAIRRSPRAGVIVGSVAALGLVLNRSTFAWPFLVAWIAALGWLALRGRRLTPVLALGLGLPLAAGLAVQAHHWASFGSVTMSSWSGQNVIESQWASGQLSITEAARERIAADPCQAAVLAAFEERALNIYDPGGMFNLPGCAGVERPAPRGIAAWDEPFKDEAGTEVNLNEGRALATSRTWSGIATAVVLGDPLQLARKALTSPTGPRESGLGRFLGPSEDFPWVTQARAHLPLATVTGAWSLLFAPACWVLVLLGWLQAARRRESPLRAAPAFWFASGLLAFHAAATLLAQYAEAMRYRAEADAVLLLAATLALSAMWGAGSTSRGSAAR